MDERIGRHYRKRTGVDRDEVVRVTASSSEGYVEAVVITATGEEERLPGRPVVRRISLNALSRSWERTTRPHV